MHVGDIETRRPEGRIPPQYRQGYDRASREDSELALLYVRHTVMDDPLADAAIGSVAEFCHEDIHQLISAGMGGMSMHLQRRRRHFRGFSRRPGACRTSSTRN